MKIGLTGDVILVQRVHNPPRIVPDFYLESTWEARSLRFLNTPLTFCLFFLTCCFPQRPQERHSDCHLDLHLKQTYKFGGEKGPRRDLCCLINELTVQPRFEEGWDIPKCGWKRRETKLGETTGKRKIICMISFKSESTSKKTWMAPIKICLISLSKYGALRTWREIESFSSPSFMA